MAQAQTADEVLAAAINERFTVMDFGPDDRAVLVEIGSEPFGTQFRSFAGFMAGQDFFSAETTIGGVSIRWSRLNISSTQKKQIIITTRREPCRAIGQHDLVSAYALCATGSGADAHAEGSGKLNRAWTFAFGGHGGDNLRRGGDALAIGGTGGGEALAFGGNSTSNAHYWSAGAARARALAGHYQAFAQAGDGFQGATPVNGHGKRGADAVASGFQTVIARGGRAPGPDWREHREGGNASAECLAPFAGLARAFGGKGADFTHVGALVPGGKGIVAKGGRGGKADARGRPTCEATGGNGGDVLAESSGNGGDGGNAVASSLCESATATGGQGGIGRGGGFKGGMGGTATAIGVTPSATGGPPGGGLDGADLGSTGEKQETTLPPCP